MAGPPDVAFAVDEVDEMDSRRQDFSRNPRSIDYVGCHPSPRCVPQEGHGDEGSSLNFERSILCRFEVGDE